MANIAVVTDSVACLPPDLVKKYQIYVAPVQVTWDGVTYRDGIDISAEEFYKRLRTSKTLPTTSSAVQGEFIQIYENLKDKVDGIVTVVISGALGAALNAANNARDIVKGVPVEIVDTRSALMGQGFVVLQAARAAAAGGTLEEVAKAAQITVPKINVIWAMDTLEYLKRSGRISLPQAILAKWLNVKPLLEITGGKVEPLAKTRSKEKAIDKMLEVLKQRAHSGENLHLALIHGNVPEEAEKLEQTVSAQFNYFELLKTEITPVIGTYVGPGALGLAFFNE